LRKTRVPFIIAAGSFDKPHLPGKREQALKIRLEDIELAVNYHTLL
jgi:hypothetical protein